MASSQRPRTSLPPELSAIDEGWGDDEQTTLPRPARVPGAEIRPAAPEINYMASQPSGLELELLDEDIQERLTKAPQFSVDEYARELMSNEAQQAITEAPPPYSMGGESMEFRLELGFSSGGTYPSGGIFAENERPTAINAPSQAPTAPPPVGFDPERARTLPHGEFDAGMELDLQSELPPPYSAMSPDRASKIVSSRPPAAQRMMKDRFAMGDFSGALEVAEQILQQQPQDTEARSLAEKCREVLLDMYSSRIAGLDRVPQIAMNADQIRWLSLDHRAGFMLSMVDGISSIDDLLDVSGMQRLDALRILCSLLDQKVIVLH